ncbi:hypothetical protein EJ08DRAFT_439061 [Tothia fuscella]|uniref:Uncharacterized protein n=1 Tax=Tothia fuscella TaxID=1048955 RepID=A0A9P4TUN3_9PEZI|nr:hypothetical protein EJ08DRAFT_439061 [Tothia fuscella]
MDRLLHCLHLDKARDHDKDGEINTPPPSPLKSTVKSNAALRRPDIERRVSKDYSIEKERYDKARSNAKARGLAFGEGCKGWDEKKSVEGNDGKEVKGRVEGEVVAASEERKAMSDEEARERNEREKNKYKITAYNVYDK